MIVEFYWTFRDSFCRLPCVERQDASLELHMVVQPINDTFSTHMVTDRLTDCVHVRRNSIVNRLNCPAVDSDGELGPLNNASLYSLLGRL